MEYPPYLTLHRYVEILHNIYWFSLLHKPAKIYIICILNFSVNLCWLVGGKSLAFSRFRPYSIFVLEFLLFICILNFSVSLCWLVGGKSSAFSRFSPYSIYVLEFLLFTLCYKFHNDLTFIMKFGKVLDSLKETSL